MVKDIGREPTREQSQDEWEQWMLEQEMRAHDDAIEQRRWNQRIAEERDQAGG